MRILHLTPHLGGGVGRVLLNYMEHDGSTTDHEHAIACLEYANEDALRRASSLGIPVSDQLAEDPATLLDSISRADITLIHWWNHPLLWQLMLDQPLPPARVLLWSHVAGHTAPQVFTRDLIFFPDRFVLATEFSRESSVIRDLTREEREQAVRTVFTCAGIEHVQDVTPRPHDGFRIGYIGTVDYCKMHPSFLAWCAAADIPDVVFVVCGGDRHEDIRAEAEAMGIAHRFQFLGQVPDIRSHLATFDVFGYPLNRAHYGTGEQVLIEALAAGVPPVVLGGGAESHVVTDGIDGLVVDDEADYPRALEQLHGDPDLRRRLAHNARTGARQHYTIESTARAWNAVFDEVLTLPRRPRRWPTEVDTGGLSGGRMFVTSLGDQAGPFAHALDGDHDTVVAAEAAIAQLPYHHRTPTRGTALHYRQFFPEDGHLQRWCRLLAETGEG